MFTPFIAITLCELGSLSVSHYIIITVDVKQPLGKGFIYLFIYLFDTQITKKEKKSSLHRNKILFVLAEFLRKIRSETFLILCNQNMPQESNIIS